MLQQLRIALISFLALTVLTGLLYPLAITGLAQTFFPRQANGRLIVEEGKIRGSVLIGQPFDDPRYFWPRPSATEPFPYSSASSSGSNDGPLSPRLKRRIQARLDALRAADPRGRLPIPADLVTASASGLDPHISPAAALYQAPRVAKARGLGLAAVQRLIRRYTEPRQLGFLGEPVVNVLLLNRALDHVN